MRDYGVVKTRFWDWAKRKKLSPGAKEMALYLLTCEHANSLGCYRLPLAYVCDDLAKTMEEVSDALAELDVQGFIHRDADSGWTWIVDYLEHNPIPNGNVGKAVGKMLVQVPGAMPFYAELLASLHGLEHFPPNLIDTLRERYLKGIDTVSRRGKTHTQTHTHDHIHEHEQTQGGGGAVAPSSAAAAVEIFNVQAAEHDWPKVQVLRPDRKRALDQCLKAVGGIEGWQTLLAKVQASDFLMGRTRRSDEHASWRFDFDFLVKPKRYTKLMEGGYDNPSRSHQGAKSALSAALTGLAD